MKLFLIAATIFCILPNAFGEIKTVRVGAYEFPPFVIFEKQNIHGLTIDTIEILNKIQKQYKFELYLTSSKRRYSDFKQNYDLIIFEDPKWGWQNQTKMVASKTIVSGKEVFIAAKTPQRDQSFFENLEKKTLLGIIGYHYAFLNYSTNPKDFKKYNIRFSPSHQDNIQAVATQRADIAAVSSPYLNYFLKTHPQFSEKILVSQHPDHEFEQKIIGKAKGPILVEELNHLIEKLKDNAEFVAKLKEYQISK